MTKGDIYYRAVLARDYRFDGKFFVGVKTTGIYCRPICPARPKRENVEFYPTAIAAEKDGFRPCLRCRPECAPSTPAWSGKSAVVQRALRLIASQADADLSEDRFAAKLGLSARHLRRLFEEELGQTPKQIADNNRLSFARRLVVETTLPVAEIAFAAGFRSLRRFNDAFAKRFKRSPSELRKKSGTASTGRFLDLSLAFRPPFDWNALFEFHRRHAIVGLESFEEGVYERLFEQDGAIGVCRVSFPGGRAPVLKLSVSAENPRTLLPVSQRVRRMFDLDSDPLLIANQFEDYSLPSKLFRKYPGLRLPRGWDPFETAITTILGQLVSVEQGGRLVAQLVQHYGRKVTHPITGAPSFLFPTPERLATAELPEVKTTQARRRTIREIATLVVQKKLALSDTQDFAGVRETLLAVPGIGPWSAEYIALRALGDTDAFPGTDLILKRAVEKHPELDLNSVRPWLGYLAIYLWKEYAISLSKTKKGTKNAVL